MSDRTFLGRVGPDHHVSDALRSDVPPVPMVAELDEGTWGEFTTHDGGARLVGEPLARPETARAAIFAVAAKRGVSPLHSVAARAEAQAIVDTPGIDDPTLRDLTHLPFVTIDEPHSLDLDQAVFIEPSAAAGFRVWYAIADPSWAVRPGTALFEEALARGSTYYLPGLVAPMLPASLSEGVISLNPGVDRRALVFEVQLDAEGEVVETVYHRARVRSRVKTSYDAVQVFYDGAAAVPGVDEVAASLEALATVGRLRIARAAARDIVQVRRREIALSLDDGDGLRFVALDDPRNDVERFNEQISLLCNVEGARLLQRGANDDDGVEPIYRVHASPREDRLQAFARQTKALARAHGLDEAVWRWRRERSLAEYLARLPNTGGHTRLARAIHRQALMTGGRSGYSPTPARHHGVGADVYARFTAPMREIVGIFTHKEAWEKLGLGDDEGPVAPTLPVIDDRVLRTRVSEAANRARHTQRVLEREANRLVIDQLFGDDWQLDDARRPVRSGTVMGISRGKVHVQLDDPPVDVKVYLPHLAAQLGHSVRIDRAGVAVRDRHGVAVVRMGDAVAIRVSGRDEDRDRWTLELVAR